MSEEIKKVVVKESDGAYVKASELTAEQIKELPKGRIIFTKVQNRARGQRQAYTRYMQDVEICPVFKYHANIQETEFNNIAYNLAPKTGLSSDLDKYTFSCYLRYVKGKAHNEQGEEYEYLLVQAFLTKDYIISFFINKKNRSLELFNALVESGKIKVNEYVINNNGEDLSLVDENSETDLF